nr:hypothetical protein P5629_05425 [Bacillus subtilis]
MKNIWRMKKEGNGVGARGIKTGEGFPAHRVIRVCFQNLTECDLYYAKPLFTKARLLCSHHLIMTMHVPRGDRITGCLSYVADTPFVLKLGARIAFE